VDSLSVASAEDRRESTILSLRPNVSPEEAIRLFAPRGPLGHAKDLCWGPLRGVAAAYVPLKLFRVAITNRAQTTTCIFGLEAVTGALDLYEFARPPGDGELIEVTTRNYALACLDDDHARVVLGDKVRRILFSRGFFRVRDLRITITPLHRELFVPYWLGFRGRRDQMQLALLDAVRRRPEGAKARALFHQWLLA